MQYGGNEMLRKLRLYQILIGVVYWVVSIWGTSNLYCHNGWISVLPSWAYFSCATIVGFIAGNMFYECWSFRKIPVCEIPMRIWTVYDWGLLILIYMSIATILNINYVICTTIYVALVFSLFLYICISRYVHTCILVNS